MEESRPDHSLQKDSDDPNRSASLICVFNNEGLYEELLASIASQSFPYEIEVIGIDNTGGRYPSAASALNEGVRQAQNDWLIFVHQDIELLDKDELLRLVELMEEQPQAIYGVAGVPFPGEARRTISAIKEGYKGFAYATLKENKVEGFTLDECMFACHKRMFEKLEFDEDVCNSWHFYAVDLCLQACLMGIPSFIVRANVWHKSRGSKNDAFWASEKRLERKYRKSFKVISSTCTRFPTGRLHYRLHCLKRKGSRFLRAMRAS